MPELSHANADLYYEVHGEGPALVFLHGAGGNTVVWWQQVPEFAGRYRVITLDHRGFGRSRCKEGFEHARHFADDLAAVLDDEGVDRAALVCQSMGGWTGMQFALANPDRVRCLVLSGTPGGVETPALQEALAAVARGIAEARGRAAPSPSGGFLGHAALAPDAATRDPIRTFLYTQIDGLNLPMAALKTGLFELGVPLERLEGFSTPTLLIAGELDQVFPLELLRTTAGVIPGCEFQTVAGVGHSPYFEAPEEWNGILQEFLDRHEV